MKRLILTFVLVILLFSLALPSASFAADDATDSKQSGQSNPFLSGGSKDGFIEGKISEALPGDADVLRFISNNKVNLQLHDTKSSFIINRKNKDQSGRTHYTLQQTHNGVPVHGSYLQVNLDSSQQIYALQNNTEDDQDLSSIDTSPTLKSVDAIKAFKSDLESQYQSTIELGTKVKKLQYPQPTAKLLIYPYQDQLYLAYEVNMVFVRPEHANWVGYVDAHTGEIIDKYNKLQEGFSFTKTTGTGYGYNGKAKSLNIAKYTETSGYTDYELFDLTHHGDIFTGSYYEWDDVNLYATWSKTSTFKDGSPGYPPHYYSAAVDAHYNANIVYNYYLNSFDRDSLDGYGMDIVSFVNVPDSNGFPMDNAGWDGYGILYGDGTGVANGGNNCFSCALDVVAHELTHGVTDYTAGLEYRGESGALNESISDIMGTVIDSDDWNIGEDTGKIGRSLQNPNAYRQPTSMNDSLYPYQWTTGSCDIYNDNCGVHYNSGIPNHAAFLIADKIDKAGISLKGRTILGQLTYAALTRYLTPTSGFRDARNSYLLAASDLTGITDQQRTKIRSIIIDAWAEVGITDLVHDLKAVAISPTSAALTWSSGSGATAIEISQTGDGYVTWEAASTGTLAPTATSATVKNLIPGRTYHFRLTIYGGNSDGDSNDAVLTMPATPVSTFINTSKSATTASFNWPEAADATQVVIQQSVDNASWANAATTDPLFPNATVATVKNLIPNKTYKFRLSVTGGGYAGISNTVDVKTDVLLISDLVVMDKSGTSVSLSWSAARDATNVSLQQSINGGSTWTTAKTSTTLNSTSTDTNVTGLLAGTAYKFRLLVTGGQNAGYSNVAEATTNSVPVADFANKSVTSTTATFGWTAAVRATGILIEQSTDGGATWNKATYSAIAPSANKATVTGLLPNTNYRFRMSVTGGANAGTSNPTGAKTTPLLITSFASTDKTPTTISFKWTPSANPVATNVIIQQSTDKGATWTTAESGDIAANATTATVTGLTPNKAYSFRLRVTGGANDGPSNAVTASTLPQPITSLAVTDNSATTVSLSWTAAADASTVIVQQSANNGTSWTTAVTGTLSKTATEATVTKLLQGAPYKFRLLVTGGQNAGNSTMVEATTNSVPIADFANKSVTSTTATFGWTAAVRATGILIEQSADDGATWNKATYSTISPSANKATVTGLLPNSDYKFRMTVTSGANAGTSNPTAAKTPPLLITNFASTDKTPTTISFKWTPSANPVATNVIIQQSTDKGATWTTAESGDIAANATTATVTGLTPNKAYSFRLRVTGGANDGPSNAATASTLPQPITSLAVTDKSTTTVSLSWTAAADASTVIVQQSANNGTSWTTAVTGTLSKTATEATVTKLLQGAPYKFRLLVTGGQNAGNSIAVDATTNSVPIADFSNKSVTPTTATLGWTAAVRATGVLIEQSADGGATWNQATYSAISPSANKVTVTGLLPNSDYQFRMTVAGGANAGTSNPTGAKTTPLLITSFSSTDRTQTTISFKWTPNPSPAATAVIIEQSTDKGANWTTAESGDIAANATTATVTGLTPNKAYSFRLRVTGGANDGPSNAVTASTLPQPITSLDVTNISTTTVSLSWTAAVDASTVIVQQSANNGTSWTTAVTGTLSKTATEATVTKLLQGAPYKFRLLVTGGENAGSSIAVEATTNSVPIADFANKSVTSTTATFGWTAAFRATGILIEQSADDGETWDQAIYSAIAPSANKATVTGLLPNTNYQFRLTIIGGANEGVTEPITLITP